jgi:hypothetical protein
LAMFDKQIYAATDPATMRHKYGIDHNSSIEAFFDKKRPNRSNAGQFALHPEEVT